MFDKAEQKPLMSRRDALLMAWVGFLVVAAGLVTSGLVLVGYRVEHPIGVIVLAILAVAAEREGIRLSPAVEVSVASILYIFAAVAFGPLPAVIIGGAGVLADL